MITPTGHRVLIKPDEIEEVSEGGIVLTHTDQAKKLEEAGQVFGTIKAIGFQAWKAFGKDHSGEPWAKVGDRVLFSKYSGFYLEDPADGENYKIVNDEDIVAVITED